MSWKRTSPLLQFFLHNLVSMIFAFGICKLYTPDLHLLSAWLSGSYLRCSDWTQTALHSALWCFSAFSGICLDPVSMLSKVHFEETNALGLNDGQGATVYIVSRL